MDGLSPQEQDRTTKDGAVNTDGGWQIGATGVDSTQPVCSYHLFCRVDVRMHSLRVRLQTPKYAWIMNNLYEASFPRGLEAGQNSRVATVKARRCLRQMLTCLR